MTSQHCWVSRFNSNQSAYSGQGCFTKEQHVVKPVCIVVLHQLAVSAAFFRFSPQNSSDIVQQFCILRWKVWSLSRRIWNCVQQNFKQMMEWRLRNISGTVKVVWIR